jgi:hypothetical protein
LRFSVRHQSSAAAHLFTKSTGSGIVHEANQSGAGKGFATLTLLPADTTTYTEISSTLVTSLLAELEVVQLPNEPETLDEGFLTVEPAVRKTL